MDAMDRIERILLLMIENDGREIRRQREETKRLIARFKQREEEWARQLEQARAGKRPLFTIQQPDPPIKDGTVSDPPE